MQTLYIESINIPNSVLTIGIVAFSGCSKLKEFTFSENLKKISFESFANCDALENLVIPNKVESIDMSAFICCDNLKSVRISDSVKSIDREAFAECGNLTSVICGKSLKEIGYQAFGGCWNLKEMYFLSPEKPKFGFQGRRGRSGVWVYCLPDYYERYFLQVADYQSTSGDMFFYASPIFTFDPQWLPI